MESQTPPGPRPPAKQEPPKSDTVWISPRLREKLDESQGDAPRQGGSPVVGIVLAVLVIGGGIGLVAAMRGGAAKEKAAAQRRAQLAAQAAVAESIANAARIDSMRAMRDTSGSSSSAAARPSTPTAPKPASAARAPSASAGASSSTRGVVEAAPAPAPAAEPGPFGLDVGTFLVEDRATSEQQRLSASTGLAGKVVTRNEDGADVYHVVLGSFPSRAAAERKAGSLVAKGLVNQARTVPLTP